MSPYTFPMEGRNFLWLPLDDYRGRFSYVTDKRLTVKIYTYAFPTKVLPYLCKFCDLL